MHVIVYTQRKAMSVDIYSFGAGPEGDHKINPVTSKRKVKGSKELNVSDGDRIIVKIEANFEEVGFSKQTWKTPTPDGKKKVFYAIAEIDKVQIFHHKYKTLIHPQPTIKPIAFTLEDGRKIQIQPTDNNEPAQKVPGIGHFSHLIAKTSSPQTTDKWQRPFHTAVMFDAYGRQTDKSFVFVYFSGESAMSEKMLKEQKEAVETWFPNFISAFKKLFEQHEQREIMKKQEEIRKREEHVRKLAEDPEYRRQWENLGNDLGAPRASGTEVDTWSKCEPVVKELDEHLKWLGINRAMDTAGADVIKRMKKEKSMMVHTDKCPDSFKRENNKKQEEWIKKAAGKVPVTDEECKEAIQKVNNAYDEVNKCF